MRSGRIDPLGRLQLFLYQMRIGYTDIPFDPNFFYLRAIIVGYWDINDR